MKKLAALLLSTLLCLPLCGCAAQVGGTVVCSFYPVYIFAQNVLQGVEGISVACLTPPSTGCLHDYQLLTSDMRALYDAKAFIINGAGMEQFLEDVTSRMETLPVVDCSIGVSLLKEQGHDDHDHDHAYNAHMWLDAGNARLMVDNMAAQLCEIFPQSAALIAKNAAAYSERLAALDDEIAQALGTLKSRDIVSFHEAYSYFAEAYGLNIIAEVTLDTDQAPSPRLLSDVVQKVQAAGKCPLFSEPNVSASALRVVQSETGAPLYALDPITRGEGAKDAYEVSMRQNMQIVLEALGE